MGLFFACGLHCFWNPHRSEVSAQQIGLANQQAAAERVTEAQHPQLEAGLWCDHAGDSLGRKEIVMETAILFVLGIAVFSLALHVLQLSGKSNIRVISGLILVMFSIEMAAPGWKAAAKFIFGS